VCELDFSVGICNFAANYGKAGICIEK
jgi:hypothetical protein